MIPHQLAAEYLIETSEDRIRVKFSDISYLESMGHETFIHLTEGSDTIRSRKGLTELQKRLEAGAVQAGMAFFRPHHSYLVSIADNLRIARKELEMAGVADVSLSPGESGKSKTPRSYLIIEIDRDFSTPYSNPLCKFPRKN